MRGWRCVGAGMEGSLRLTTFGDDDTDNDPEAGVGVLEVFHAGAWGTICNGEPRSLDIEEEEDYDSSSSVDYRLPDLDLTQVPLTCTRPCTARLKLRSVHT